MKLDDIRFSAYADEALASAKLIAAVGNCEYIQTIHILMGLYRLRRGTAYKVLLQNGYTSGMLSEASVKYCIPKLGKKKRLEYSTRAYSVISSAETEARSMKCSEVGTEHLLMALLRDKSSNVYAHLKDVGINTEKVYKELLMSCGMSRITAERVYKLANSRQAKKKSILEEYTVNISDKAEKGELDTFVGRTDELLRMIQILGRRTKNNVCLVGEPGVGKTAIVEGFASMIAVGNVPDHLMKKKVLSLNISSLLAGTRYRGEFEEKMKNVLDELKNRGDVILFIDELHTLVGAGGSEGSASDAANIMKPALSRGELQVIGATTVTEYRKHIEKDSALARRFQRVDVDEPTPEATVDILRGVAPRYEEYHGVEITEEAIEAAVQLSVRYINDRFLPDKAIDLMDESCAHKVMDRVGISKEMVFGADRRRLSDMQLSLEEALRKDDMAQARKLHGYITNLRAMSQTNVGLTVTADDIAETLAIWTDIPVTRISETEQSRLLKLEDTLHRRVIGQDEGVSVVARAIKRARTGLRNPKRPIGAFLFLGPTGVGKTELSKTLAEALFGDEKNLIRVDMSEYMEKFSVSKLIGSPPGYVGYEEGGQLSERVRQNPYSVILFDEVEKAHPDVFNVLLQVLDDGIITDAQGRRIDFKNTIIIMTSNLGAEKIIDPGTLGFVGKQPTKEESYERMRDGVMEEVEKLFRPEFINRLDEIVVFKQLSEDEIKSIVRLQLDELRERVEKAAGVKVTFTPAVRSYIFKRGYDERYGARPIRRALQTYIEDPLSDFMLSESIEKGGKIRVGIKEDSVEIRQLF